MADEEIPGAGTPDPTASDSPEAAPPATGEEGSDQPGGADEDVVHISKQEYLVLKDARQREKQVTAELERTRAERTTAPPTPSAPETDDAEATREHEQYIAYLRQVSRMKSTDPEAQAQIQNAKALLHVYDGAERARNEATAAEQRTLIRQELAAIPVTRQDEVIDYMRQTGVRSPKVALQLINGKQYESLSEKNARLEKELADLRAGRTEKPTPSRIVGSPGGARTEAKHGSPITLAQYHERMAKDPATTIAERARGVFTIKVD